MTGKSSDNTILALVVLFSCCLWTWEEEGQIEFFWSVESGLGDASLTTLFWLQPRCSPPGFIPSWYSCFVPCHLYYQPTAGDLLLSPTLLLGQAYFYKKMFCSWRISLNVYETQLVLLSLSFSPPSSFSLSISFQYQLVSVWLFFAPTPSLPPVSLSHSICLVTGTAWVPSPKWGLWDGRFAISQGLLCTKAVLEGRQIY